MRDLINSRQRWLSGMVCFLALVLSGCATQTRTLMQTPVANLPPRAELTSTPFFPQERYQCGPAALAMSLQTAGVKVSPDALVSQVYVPQREGSLQAEMLAAGRRNGTLSVTIPPRLDALLTEVANGSPVVVLQNLSLPWFPLWHYAVVIGYDLQQGDIVLRSGTTERLTMPLSTFERTWARSDYWGMMTLSPGQLPITAEENAVVSATVALEKGVNPADARHAYEAALRRWPQNLTLQLGAGNAAYASGDHVAAAEAFRRATQMYPDSAPAFNNLATVLAELSQFDEALEAAHQAVEIGGPWRNAAQTTLEMIEAERRKERQ